MNIEKRLRKLEAQNGSVLSEYCNCGHKNKVKMKSVKSDENGTIYFDMLPCERCEKPVLTNIPETFTFTINSGVELMNAV